MHECYIYIHMESQTYIIVFIYIYIYIFMYTGIMIFLDFCLIHLQIDILGGSNNAQVFAVFGFVISMTPGS